MKKNTGAWSDLAKSRKRVKTGKGGYIEQNDVNVGVIQGRNDDGEMVQTIERSSYTPSAPLEAMGDLTTQLPPVSRSPSPAGSPAGTAMDIDRPDMESTDLNGGSREDDVDAETDLESQAETEADDVDSIAEDGLSTSRAPIRAWMRKRKDFLTELIRLDGRAEAATLATENKCRNPKCRDTRTHRKFYRCLSGCMRCDWMCRGCIVKKHSDLPLHRVEIWLEGHWQQTTLRKLGVSVSFGHNGKPCPQPRRTIDDFVVIHTNGLHEVKAVFCGCTFEYIPVRDQLLRARWWPATVHQPQTAATFEALDAFDALGGAGKTNAYEYYNSLCLLTDATGLHKLPDRYKEFTRITHEWRHIHQCKRAGRGHDRFGGIEETEAGDLAVLCPTCPHEGLNTDIEELLRDISPHLVREKPNFERVLVAMDCNFRTRNRENRSDSKTSPTLGNGMAYMVPEAEYDAFTENSKHQQEMSSCSRFGAMILANLKKGKGYRTTGIGGVFCSRHGYWWPNSVGTLIKGERYCTMDFILAAVALRLRTSNVHIAYDIICQYAKNLLSRLETVEEGSFIYEGAQKLLHDLEKTYAVPKFHNPGHKELCQQWFNISFQKYCGQTDGETSERAWAGLNPATSSMREMGPGRMRDTIDFYCGIWNWRKTIGMGPFLQKKLEIALAEGEDHSEIYTGLREVLLEEDYEKCMAWINSVLRWEARDEDGKVDGQVVSNPYKPLAKPITLHQARLRSAQAMNDALNNVGAAASQSSATQTASPEVTNFILLGFKIELLQLRGQAARSANTALQKAQKIENDNELLRQIAVFRKQQQWIMPLVYAGLKELEGDESDEREEGVEDDAEDKDSGEDLNTVRLEASATGLYLPSELPVELAVQQHRDMLLEELRLRWGGLSDSIIMVRQNLQIRGVVHLFRKGSTRGQRGATRAQGMQAVIEANLAVAKASYRLHRKRFEVLASMLPPEDRDKYIPPDWESRFRVLEDHDCVSLGSKILVQIEKADTARARSIITAKKGGNSSGTTHHKVSWLWYTPLDAALDLNDDMRVEFLRCRARAMRWVEEVYHLCYEMVRTPLFAMRKAEWWARKAILPMPGMDKATQDGTRAYARKQSAMFRRQSEALTARFEQPLRDAASFLDLHGIDGLLKKNK
ncbi:unnamed protein product [Peniophora sp. CBMAI 1063]|nr:unnamed protein product [Peniophora sp. CBMAI 1063]